MEVSETGIAEDRIATLEKRIREMEVQVKGLIGELLDFQAIAMTMSKKTGESSYQELMQEPVVPGASFPAPGDSSPSVAASSYDSTLIRPGVSCSPDVPVALAEPAMARIMQADGTMKMEPRYGERNSIDSSRGYGSTRKGASSRSRQNPLVYAAEENKSGPA